MDATSKTSNAFTRVGKCLQPAAINVEINKVRAGSNRTLPKLDGRPYRRTWTTDRYSVQKDKRAKQVLEFLSCRVRHAAPEAEITMTERRQRGNIMWDALDTVVRETDTWSKEYLEWKRGLDSSE